MTIFRSLWHPLVLLACIAATGTSTSASADLPDDAALISGYSVARDISYGPDDKQVFDVYVAEPGKRSKPTPATIIFVHGGGYYLSDKTEEEKYIIPLLNRGFDVVNTNYRLGEGIFAAMEDLASLLDHLVLTGKSYGLASERLVLMGFSAGGQMSANLGLLQNEVNNPFGIPQTAKIAAIVNISGPSHNLREVEQIFLNFDSKLFRELGAALFPPHPRYTKAQVITFTEPDNHFDANDPPFFLWYGGKDPQIPPTTHERLLLKLQADPAKTVLFSSPRAGTAPQNPSSTGPSKRSFASLTRFDP